MKRKPMFDGLGPDMLPYTYPSVTWDLIKKLRDTVKMKIVCGLNLVNRLGNTTRMRYTTLTRMDVIFGCFPR